MRNVAKALPLALVCAMILAVPSVWAYWPADGIPLCTLTSSLMNPSIISDGSGGAIVAWMDIRSGGWDIYARAVDALGDVRWAADGVAVSVTNGDQAFPSIVSDGAGGFIAAWLDTRNGGNDIYAQRMSAAGDAQWTENGVAVCTALGDQFYPKSVPDGAGGAIIVWHDSRNGNWDIYAQRVNAAGVPQWTANGVAVCTATGLQDSPMLCSDGASGAIVAWQDYRSGGADVYAQRVNASGAAQWTANGVAVCAATGNQQYPVIVSDGVDGAIVVWMDNRTGPTRVYAQRVDGSGAVQWTVDGEALVTVASNQYYPAAVSDGMGGAIATWYDLRTGNSDIYAQRVDDSGAKLWDDGGAAICTAPGSQYYQQLASDGEGGAIFAWTDLRTGSYGQAYVQRANADGITQWTADGVRLCATAKDQGGPQIAAEGTGGGIVTWADMRAGNADLYAQLIDRFGRVGSSAPRINAVRDVPGDEGGMVYLSWYASRPDLFMDPEMSYYSIWRAINPTRAALALENGAAALDDLSRLDAGGGGPVIRVETASGRTFFWELMETVSAFSMEAYGKPVATLFDSTAFCSEQSYFQVVGHTTDARIFWKSEPDSGYSVDNLPPAAPAGLAGEQSFAPMGMFLTWSMNREGDLSHYAIYRGTSDDFVPGPENLVATRTDPWWFDEAWRWGEGFYYKISAADVHDNESGFALLTPDGVTGTDTPKAPDASYLAQNYPNPFNPTTRIAFGLSAPAHVSLRIYDAAGRLVRALVNEARRAGRYEESWDGRDSSGRSVASGIYFYKLTAGSFEKTHKMALMR
jgi:hypothetical protein